MELIRISDSKLKVMLSEEDMLRYDISGESMDYETTETRRVLWQILDEAHKKTGFDAAKDRVYIQMYPAPCGGCEMFVTKMKALPGGTVVTLPEEKRESVYIFPDVDTLVRACRRLSDAGYADASETYVSGDGDRYYLSVRERFSESLIAENGIPEYGFLTEYGTRQSGILPIAYIKEHAHLLFGENAVARITELYG